MTDYNPTHYRTETIHAVPYKWGMQDDTSFLGDPYIEEYPSKKRLYVYPSDYIITHPDGTRYPMHKANFEATGWRPQGDLDPNSLKIFGMDYIQLLEMKQFAVSHGWELPND